MRDFNQDGVVVGRPYQEIFEQSATQKYPIGTIHERHGRRFRYGYAATALSPCRGAANGNIIPGDTGGSSHGVEGNLYAEAPVGQKWVDVATSTAFAVDYFVGGLFVVFSTGATPSLWCARISGNDLGDGTSCKVYLDEPIPVKVTTSYGVNLHPSPYSRVSAGMTHQDYESFVCVPHYNVEAGYYFWGQTRGPCWVTPTGSPNTWPGYGAGGRDCYFHIDGTIMQTEDRDLSTYSPQRAGYVLASSATATYGDGVIMLMLE